MVIFFACSCSYYGLKASIGFVRPRVALDSRDLDLDLAESLHSVLSGTFCRATLRFYES